MQKYEKKMLQEKQAELEQIISEKSAIYKAEICGRMSWCDKCPFCSGLEKCVLTKETRSVGCYCAINYFDQNQTK